MSLLSLPFGWFVAGSLVLAAGLFGLHLLRVRLVRVPVETLLFFRSAQAPLRPRSLVGSPRRLLSYLLSLALLLALWLAFAEPFVATQGRSRIVLVDASGSAMAQDQQGTRLLDARLARAEELVHAGLGPRGALLAYSGSVSPLWHLGDAAALVAERAKGLVPSGSGSGLWKALSIARGRLAPGDDVLLLGGPAFAGAQPELATGIALLREEPKTAAGPLPKTGIPLARAAEPLRVAALGELGPAVRTALAADPGIVVVAAAAQAEVVVTLAASNTDQPCLVIESGEGDAEREPLLAPDAPFTLSLRDRRGRGKALAGRAGETAWVIDAKTQQALVAASSTPVPCVRVVSWLLDEGAHRDVPRVLLGALHLLAQKPTDLVASVGDPLFVPATTTALATLTGPARAGSVTPVGVAPVGVAPVTVAPVRGAYPVLCSEAGHYTLATPGRTVAIDAALKAEAEGAAAPKRELESCAFSGALLGTLLALALALMALESLFYWRGKVP